MKRLLAAAIFAAILPCALSCTDTEKKSSNRTNRTEHISGKTLAETIAGNQMHLLSLPGVIKVEAGDCETDSCIKVFVEQKTAMLASQIPLMLETWRVDVVERGK